MRFSVALSITLEELHRIDRARGRKTRSQFVREAIAHYLKEGQSSGANGKSTFFRVLESLFGKNNVSFESINNLEWNRFAAAELDGKLANIHSDISNDEISRTGLLKQLITGDPMTVERKHRDPFTLANYAKLFFHAMNFLKYLIQVMHGS